MRSIFPVIIVSALVGTAIGAGMAIIEIGTAMPPLPASAAGEAQGVPDVSTAGKFPKLEVDSAEYEFGTMQRGTRKKHSFVLSNTGDAPLRLEVGQPSCKCTVGELEKDVLQPGESVNLNVEWIAKVVEGPFRQHVPITTNDPTQSSLELTIVGNVALPTGLLPRELGFGRVRYGEEQTSEVVLLSFLKDELIIHSAEINREEDRDKFDIEIKPLAADQLPDPKAKAGVRIKVTAKPVLPVGGFVQWVSLKTNLEEAEELDVPIVGRVVGDISIAGQGWNTNQDTLRLGRVLSSEGKTATLKIIVRSMATDTEISDIEFEVGEVDPKELRVTLGKPRQIKTVTHIPLTIEIPAGTRNMVRLNPDTDGPATIRIKTTHPQAPELLINVLFAIE